MTLRSNTFAAAIALACGIGLAATAAHAATLSSTDHDFLVSTAQGTTYELAAAKLAKEKATRDDIKGYAQKMIDDHGTLNPKLHALAKQNGIDLPTTMTDAKTTSLRHLQSLDGAAFDKAFVSAEAKDNEADLAAEQKEINSTDNAQVKALVEQLKQSDTKHAMIGKALQQAGH